MSRRLPTELTFDAGDVAAVARVVDGVLSGGGWVNLTPGRGEDLAEFVPGKGIFSVLAGAPAKPFAEVSIVPGKVLQIGVHHGLGRLGLSGLAERGCALPDGWRLSQDHARRGLIVAPTPDGTVIARWVVDTLRGLSAIPAQPTWSAMVFSSSATTS
jgi:hypothetical protein